jgi:hypothetical protein
MSTERLYRPTTSPMTPIEGLRFYADALRGDWGSIDGRSEKAALYEYIDWASSVEANATTELDVIPKLESILGVYVREWFDMPDYHDRGGVWSWHVEELIAERDAALTDPKEANDE